MSDNAASDTLEEFLLARIAEDESVEAHDLAVCTWANDTTNGAPCDCGLPARVLAECEAKRRAVGYAASWEYAADNPPTAEIGRGLLGTARALQNVLKLLALPYADHEHYRREWRP